jgi:uncharacterized membrane protein YsdA (DUF1294 family)
VSWLYSVRAHLILALSLCAIATVAFWWFLTNHQHIWWHWLAFWLLAANLIAFGYFGLDKYLASRFLVVRIPEVVLHTLTAVGGSPGALLAMWLFRHKTIKPAFRIYFWCIVVIQAALIVYLIVKWR